MVSERGFVEGLQGGEADSCVAGASDGTQHGCSGRSYEDGPRFSPTPFVEVLRLVIGLQATLLGSHVIYSLKNVQTL